MRADNNWEENVGKRLFDFEGELSPQAWQNINQRINAKPKSRWRWLWLPAALLFIALPLAFYLNFKTANNQLAETINAPESPKNLGRQHPVRTPAKTETIGSATKEQTTLEKPGTQTNPETLANSTSEIVETNQASAVENTNLNSLPAKDKAKTKIKMLPGLVAENNSKPITKTEKAHSLAGKLPKVSGGLLATTRKKSTTETVAKSGKKVSEVTSKQNGRYLTPKTDGELAFNNKAKNQAAGQEKNNAANKPASSALAEPAKDKPANGKPVTKIAGFTDQPQNPSVNSTQEQLQVKGKAAAAVDSAAKQALVSAPQPQTDTTQKAAETKPEKVKKWQFSIYAAPQYTFQRVYANKTDDVMILRMNNKNEIENERMGYEFGFRSHYQLSEKVQLETGLQFSRLNQYLNFTTASHDADSSLIRQPNGDLLLEIRYREQNQKLLFKYFMGGVHVGANVRLGKQWSLAGGLGTNWLFWKNPDEETVPIGTKNFNPFVSAGLRYYRPLSNSITLTMGPTLQYYVRAIQNESAYYGSKPTTFGFSFGLLLHGK